MLKEPPQLAGIDDAGVERMVRASLDEARLPVRSESHISLAQFWCSESRGRV